MPPLLNQALTGTLNGLIKNAPDLQTLLNGINKQKDLLNQQDVAKIIGPLLQAAQGQQAAGPYKSVVLTPPKPEIETLPGQPQISEPLITPIPEQESETETILIPELDSKPLVTPIPEVELDPITGQPMPKLPDREVTPEEIAQKQAEAGRQAQLKQQLDQMVSGVPQEPTGDQGELIAGGIQPSLEGGAKPQSTEQGEELAEPEFEIFTFFNKEFDIKGAIKIVENEKIETQTVDVETLAKLKTNLVQTDKDTIANADISKPIIVGNFGKGHLVIDGHHRLRKALQENKPLEAIVLSEEQTSRITRDRGGDFPFELGTGGVKSQPQATEQGGLEEQAKQSKTAEDFVNETYNDLAQQQRNKPEMAMLDVQKSQISQIYGWTTEHGGDLIHRMNEDIANFKGSYAINKIEKLLRVLKSEYGFEKEAREQIESNLNYQQKKGNLQNETVESRTKELKELS